MKTAAIALVLLCSCAAGVAANDPAAPDGGTSDAGAPDAGQVVVRPDGGTVEAPPDGGQPAPTDPLITARPYNFHVPASLDTTKAAPLVILLHGYSANAVWQDAYFGLTALSDARGFLYAYPDGTIDQLGNRFWNATDACCDAFGAGVDDVAYVRAIIDDVGKHHRVDEKRVFVMGHSNGGFMAHRLACDLSDRVAGIASLAGTTWLDTTKCRPSHDVTVLQIHGDADATIEYGGGHPSLNLALPRQPGARASVALWAGFDGCGPVTDTAERRDIDAVLFGDETIVSRAATCRGTSAVELWTIHGGAHIPTLTSTFAAQAYDFLLAHPKP